jgi:hypothetical protein
LSKSITKENGRLVFKDYKALKNAIVQLSSLDQKGMDAFEDNLEFKSSRRDTSDEDLQAFGLPAAYASLINSEGEHMIGDTIVWFHDGYRHLVPKKDEALLNQIKNNPAISHIKYKAGLVRVSSSTISSEKLKGNDAKVSTIWMNASAVDARYQRDYYGDDGRSRRKWVFEVYNYVENHGSFGYWCYLITKIKHYYRGSSSWRPAGETTDKNIKNIYVSVLSQSNWDGSWNRETPIVQDQGSRDNAFLERILWNGPTASPSIEVTVRGDYHAQVVSPTWFSQSLWDVAASW